MPGGPCLTGEWGTWKVEAAESRLEAQTTLQGGGGRGGEVGEAETGGRTLGKAFMQAAFGLGLGR